MRFSTVFVIMSILAYLCAGCGGTHSTVLASTPIPGETDSSHKIPAPDGTLQFSMGEVDWMPVMIGSTNGKMLSDALKEKKAIMVALGKGMHEDTWDDKVYQMVKAASPSTKIVARRRGTLHKILLERGEIPFRKTWEAGGVDVFGRPWFIPKDHPLQTEWLSKKTELKGAEAILMVDVIDIDDQKLRQMRKQHLGGCDEILTEIEKTVDGGRSFFRPLVSSVNQSLQNGFSRQLKEAIPFWKKELAVSLQAVAPSSQEARCYNAYSSLIEQYVPCIENECNLAPALYLEGGGVIGMEMSKSLTIPGTCPPHMGRNYVEELKALGTRTVRDVLPDLPGEWAGELSKVDAMFELRTQLKQVCAPAHRRFSGEDLEAAQKKVTGFISEISTETPSGEWKLSEGQQRVPGVGAVEVLAKAHPLSGSTEAKALHLGKALRGIDKCRDGKRRPVQVALVDVGSSEVYFSAIMFEEQLICEELAPGTP